MLRLEASVDTKETYYFGILIGVLAITSGIIGLTKSKNWGYLSSYVGKAIIFLSAGLVTWGIGTLMIGYYNIALNQSYPYPSWADLAYIISWPLWFIGMFNLSKATGTRFQVKNWVGKLYAALIVIFASALSYYLLFVVARGGVFEINTENYLGLFFDFAYPIGGVVILTTSLLLLGLSANYLGGVFKAPIFLIIIGFVLNYIADVAFTYTNTLGTFYVSNWVDLIYLSVFFILGVGITLFDQKILKQTNETKI